MPSTSGISPEPVVVRREKEVLANERGGALDSTHRVSQATQKRRAYLEQKNSTRPDTSPFQLNKNPDRKPIFERHKNPSFFMAPYQKVEPEDMPITIVESKKPAPIETPSLTLTTTQSDGSRATPNSRKSKAQRQAERLLKMAD